METPNRIYLEKDKETDKIHHLWGRSPVIHSGYEHIEYIRKDALLEWAREKKKQLLENESANDEPSDVAVGIFAGLDMLIGKLNSM